MTWQRTYRVAYLMRRNWDTEDQSVQDCFSLFEGHRHPRMTALPSFASIWHTPTADCCATSRTGRPVSSCTTTSLLELLGRLRAPAGGMAGGGTPCRCPRRVAAHTACLGRTCRTWCCTCTRAAASRCARETFAFDFKTGRRGNDQSLTGSPPSPAHWAAPSWPASRVSPTASHSCWH